MVHVTLGHPYVVGRKSGVQEYLAFGTSLYNVHVRAMAPFVSRVNDDAEAINFDAWHMIT